MPAGSVRVPELRVGDRQLQVAGQSNLLDALLGGGVGFLLSTILALLVEYMHQARLRRRSGAEAH